jgi:tetratricopeptide (TPR) repeat protein
LEIFMKKLTNIILIMVLIQVVIPSMANASEGALWMYVAFSHIGFFISIPFLKTLLLVAAASYLYWRYRTNEKRALGIAAVLTLLIAIPVAVLEKRAYEEKKAYQKIEQERFRAMRERSEARRAGKHISPDFKAISTAMAAKFKSSGNSETDRLNRQAADDLLQMSRNIDTMQQKKPIVPQVSEEQTGNLPVRTKETLPFELFVGVLLIGAGLAGATVAACLRRNNLSTLIHFAALIFCGIAIIVAMAILEMIANRIVTHVYDSWFSRLIFSPLPFIVSYSLGILLIHCFSDRNKEMPVRQSPPTGQEHDQIRQADTLEQSSHEEVILLDEEVVPLDNEVILPPKRKERRRFRFTWKKIIVTLALLMLFNWLVQSFLMNALILLGSNAGTNLSLLPPQALLPFTLPTTVSFIDNTNGKPLAGRHVRVTWEYNSMGILPDSEAHYADRDYTTDAQGKLFLPPHLKPPVIYLMAFLHRYNHGIFLFLDDPGYLPANDRPYLEQRIQSEQLSERINYTPCRTSKDWECALGRAYMLPYSYLKDAIDGIVTRTGLESISDDALNDLSVRCDALVTPASRQIDEEVVRRGPQRMYAEGYIRTLIRLGRNDEAVSALPLLANRPYAAEWQEYFKGFITDLIFEQELVKEAAPLIASGRKADQLHEEGLALHKQNKQIRSLPYYQAAITLAPESSRFANNYAVAATDLQHYFLAEKLSRKAIFNDPKRANAYMSLGRVLIASNRNLAAYLLIKESLRLGYNDSCTWVNLAIVADKLKRIKEAKAAVKEARRLNPENPDLLRFKHVEGTEGARP